MQTSQPLDHGVLNLPLSKHGDIDAELDRYKAQQAREAKAARKEAAARTKELRAAAKAAVAGMSDTQVETLAVFNNMTEAQMRKKLRSIAHWEPKRALSIARLAPTGRVA